MPDEKSSVERIVVNRKELEEIEDLGSRLRSALDGLALSKKFDEGRDAACGELISIRDRLARLRRQLAQIATPSAKREPSKKTNEKSDVSTSGASSTVLAEIRLILDGMEDVVAVLLPHCSHSSGKRFLGRQRMTAEDASAIRSDFQSLGKDSVFKRWCSVGAIYTKRQISAVLANDAGGHRRRGIAHTAELP